MLGHAWKYDRFWFPSLSEDPFSSSPLDKDELDLLVGRHGMFEELERKITFKSADRMLLVGEFGSGKTSFMQCLGARTNLHLSIDRIALSEPGIELLKGHVCAINRWFTTS